MKVYELINELSKYPAGASVEFHLTLAESKINALPVADINENDEKLFFLTLGVNDAMNDGNTAILYN